MPFISTKTTAAIGAEKEKVLKEKIALAAQKELGKGESWLMLSFEENCDIWFAGNRDSDSAMIEVKIFGKAAPGAFEKMTGRLCDIISSELGVPAERIYVKYEECSDWGWNGSNF